MPRKSSDRSLRDVPHEEEAAARVAFRASLKQRGWKPREIDAAETGWEYAFDVGFECPELDPDAARDLADCLDWKGNKEMKADLIYEGICAARKLQRTPVKEHVDG